MKHQSPLTIDDPLLDLDQVRSILGGVSRPTIYRNIRNGVLPPPLKLGQLSRWRRSWIEQAIDDAAAARETRP